MNRNTLIVTAAAALTMIAGTASGQTVRATPIGSTLNQLANPGLLQLTTNNAQQQIEVIVGPLPGDVTVSGIPNLPNGGVYAGITSIRLTTGSAQDFVEFRFTSDVTPDVFVDTRGGNSDIKFTYEVPTSLAEMNTNVMVAGSTGNDVVTFNVESRVASFVSNWAVNQGAGNNETIVSFNSPEITDTLSMSLAQTSGNGADKLEIGIVSGAATLSTNISGTLGGNTDTANLFISSLVPTTGSSLYNFSLGTGNDSFSSEIIAPDSTFNVAGQVSGSDGFDTLVYKQEANGDTNLTLDGGNGNDLTDMFFKGLVTGAPKQLGGAGNDELKMFVDGPILCFPILDGGAGIDKASGFGTFISVEQIN
ncbi:MAG: hypothetical protein ACKVZJ_13140 [Phycisphaerales bacterium]